MRCGACGHAMERAGTGARERFLAPSIVAAGAVGALAMAWLDLDLVSGIFALLGGLGGAHLAARQTARWRCPSCGGVEPLDASLESAMVIHEHAEGREELRREMSDEIAAELAPRLEEEARARLTPAIEKELRPRLEKELEGRLRPLLLAEARKEVAGEVERRLRAELERVLGEIVQGRAAPAPAASAIPPPGRPPPPRRAAAPAAPKEPWIVVEEEPTAPRSLTPAELALQQAVLDAIAEGPPSDPHPADAADPHARARRLARVICSDLVLYYFDEVAKAARADDPRTSLDKIWNEAVRYYDRVTGAEIRRRSDYLNEALETALARLRAERA